MIPFEKAFAQVMDRCRPVQEAENVSLSESVGRILIKDIPADRDIPPFDRVAMDGYACRRQDLGNELEVIETVAAGSVPEKTIEKNQCAKVMTGCILPRGADMVFMVEQSSEVKPGFVKFTGNAKTAAGNFAAKGEDIKKGSTVLKKGTLIKPHHIAVLASVGITQVPVYQKLKVGIISTGSEVVDPGAAPLAHQIRDANSPQLAALVRSAGCKAIEYGIAPDEKEKLRNIIKKASGECRVILMTGGVSMGDFDLVPGILTDLGFEIIFNRVAVKPGKPTTFSVSDSSVCFGLPGNPVSAFVVFELLVKPFLYKMTGHSSIAPTLLLPLSESWSRKKSARTEWRPVILTEKGEVKLIEYHGSGHYHALSEAFGIAAIPQGVTHIEKGTIVNVRQI